MLSGDFWKLVLTARRTTRAPSGLQVLVVVLLAMVPASRVLGQQALISTMVAEISEDQYRQYQQTIEDMGLGLYGGPAYNQGYRGRDTFLGTDTQGNHESQLYLVDQFAGWGLGVSVQGMFHNVVAELPGQVTPERIYVVGAHFDTTDVIPAPGGDDDASGTAGVLEVARVLSQYRFKSTIRFIAFNAEEDGLLGSVEYVLQEVAGHDENVLGMIALDMILRPQNDANPGLPIDLDLDCQYGAGDLAWVDQFINAATSYVSDLAIDPATPFMAVLGGSDHLSFSFFGYPALMCIENTEDEILGGSNSYYHTGQDFSGGPAGAAYDYAFATDVVRATAATLAEAAEILPEAIVATAATDRGWVYQNTPVVTQDRHMVTLTISVDDDPNGNTAYEATVTVDPASAGSVIVEPTANPLLWLIKGGISGVDPVGDVTLNVTVTGIDQGGEGETSAVVTVRQLGDVDGNGAAEPGDISLLIMALNGSPPTGYDDHAFDLDANGGAEPGDVQILINVLNGQPVP